MENGRDFQLAHDDSTLRCACNRRKASSGTRTLAFVGTPRSGVWFLVMTVLILTLLPAAVQSRGRESFMFRLEEDHCIRNVEYCPPKIADVTTIDADTSSATIRWHYVAAALSRGAVANVRIHVRSPNFRLDMNVNASQANYTVEGLAAGVEYSVWLETENQNGFNYGSSQSFSTREDLSLSCRPLHHGNEMAACASVGGLAQYECLARGGPALSVEWDSVQGSYVHGKRVAGGQNIVFRFPNVSLDYAGREHCIRASTSTKRLTACFRLCVQEQIQIKCRKTKPCGRRQLHDQKLTVSCAVSGFPTPNVTWFFNGLEVTNTDRIHHGNDWHKLPSGASSARDRVFKVRPQSGVFQHKLRTNAASDESDTGTVEVRASNGYTSASQRQVIIVTYSPSEPVQMVQSPDTIKLGVPFNVRCNSFIGIANQQFSWFFTPKGSSISTLVHNGMNGVVLRTTDRFSLLVFEHANTSHSGMYRCTVQNQNGCTESSQTKVNVHAPLEATIVTMDGFISRALYGPATVSCNVSAAVTDEAPTVRWFLNWKEIRPDLSHLGMTSQAYTHLSSWRAHPGPSYVFQHNYRYDITTTNLTVNDLGLLKCVVSLKNARSSASAQLMAPGALVVITDSPRAIKLKSKDRVEISCTAFSDQLLYADDIEKVGWLVRKRNEQVVYKVETLANTAVRTDGSKHPSGNVFWKKITMTISSFSAEHAGFYMCRAPGDSKRRPSGARMQATVRLKQTDALSVIY